MFIAGYCFQTIKRVEQLFCMNKCFKLKVIRFILRIRTITNIFVIEKNVFFYKNSVDVFRHPTIKQIGETAILR